MNDSKFFLLALVLEDATNKDLEYLVDQIKKLVAKYTRGGMAVRGLSSNRWAKCKL